IYRVHAQADVRLTNAKIDHELSQGLRPDSPAAHRPHCWHPWVVPARILSGLNRLPQLAGAERPELMDLNPAPVNDPGVLPSEVRVQIPLPASAICQILSPDDMGCAQQVVLHRRLEVEQRPDP